MLRSQHRVYDDRGEVARTQDLLVAESIIGRVFLLAMLVTFQAQASVTVEEAIAIHDEMKADADMRADISRSYRNCIASKKRFDIIFFTVLAFKDCVACCQPWRANARAGSPQKA
jgi:hypothetical protein